MDVSTRREQASAHLPSNMAGELPVSKLIHSSLFNAAWGSEELNAAKRNGRMDKRCNSSGCFEWHLLVFFVLIGWFFPLIFKKFVSGFKGFGSWFCFWDFFKVFNKTLHAQHTGLREASVPQPVGWRCQVSLPRGSHTPRTPQGPPCHRAGAAYRVLRAGRASLASLGALWGAESTGLVMASGEYPPHVPPFGPTSCLSPFPKYQNT